MKEEIVEKVNLAVVSALDERARLALKQAANTVSQRKPLETDKPDFRADIDGICERFAKFLGFNFSRLVTASSTRKELVSGIELSLVRDDYFESANALEGMVSFARNTFIREYISFTTRFSSLFYHQLIDESNNPLDPELIGQAFVNALRPLHIDAKDTLTIYRAFNQFVFNDLGAVLEQANQILIDSQTKPSLEVYARNRKAQLGKRSRERAASNPVERAFADPNESQTFSGTRTPELYGVIENLLQGLGVGTQSDEPGGEDPVASSEILLPARALREAAGASNMVAESGLISLKVLPGMLMGEARIELLSRDHLLKVLDGIGKSNFTPGVENGWKKTPSLDIELLMGEALYDISDQDTLFALESGHFTVVRIVGLIYEAFAEDPSLIRPVKNLVCSTQITFMKIALSDPDFFEHDSHVARTLINELVRLGVGWSVIEQLDQDPAYCEIRDIIYRLNTEFAGDLPLLAELNERLQEFRQQQASDQIKTVTAVGENSDHNSRVNQINSYVQQKIRERAAEAVPEVVQAILTQYFPLFLQNLIMREGPGGSSWKYVINTIDELLWTVRIEKQPGDRERFEKINSSLVTNIGKVLAIAGQDQATVDKTLEQLKDAQRESYKIWESRDKELQAAGFAKEIFFLEEDARVHFGDDSEREKSAQSSESDEYLKQVDQLPVGVWVAFAISPQRSIYCSLAAKLHNIDKFIFVSRQGIKLVEQTRTGLARELQEGTVKIISDWPLFERGMEAVIASLRAIR